jgi:hypothetical protein
MARLVWNDVAAPDFSAVGVLQNNAARMIAQAVEGGQAGLNRWRDDGRERQGAELARRLMGYSDPAALQAAMAAGQITGDLGMLSAEQILQADRRFDVLDERFSRDQQQELTAGEITDRAYSRERTQERDAARDAITPLMSQLSALYGQGTPEAEAQAQALLAEEGNAGLIGALDMEDLAVFQRNIREGRTGWRELRASDWNYEDGRVVAGQRDQRFGWESQRFGWEGQRFGWELTDRADRDAATSILAMAEQMGVQSVDELRSLPMFQGASAAVQRAVSSSFASGAGGSSGGGSGGDMSTYDTVYGNGQYGDAGQPLTSMSMGAVYDFGRDMVNRTRGHLPGREGQNVGTSAMGAYQFTGPTMQSTAQAIWGDNWRSVQFTPENQERMAEHLFNQHRNSVSGLMGQWESLTRAEAQQIVNGGMNWQQARSLIHSGEAPGRLPDWNQRQAAADFVGSDAAIDQGADRGSGWRQDFVAASGDNRSQADVIDSLLGEGGGFNGANRVRVRDLLNYIQNQFDLNPAQAAALIRRGRRTDIGFGERARIGVLGPFAALGQALGDSPEARMREQQYVDLGNGMGVDVRQIADQINDLRNPDTLAAGITSERERGQVIQQTAALQAEITQLEGRIAEYQRIQQSRGVDNSRLILPLQQRLQVLQGQLRQVVGASPGAVQQPVATRPAAPVRSIGQIGADAAERYITGSWNQRPLSPPPARQRPQGSLVDLLSTGGRYGFSQ